MADPVTLLCSILTIADASKKVSDVCTYYISHAKNAPKELQIIIDDLSALTKTVKKLDQVAKSVQKTDATIKQLTEWDVPLKRLDGYTEDLNNLINRQDMKIGLFHEIAFRTRWPSAWREAQKCLVGISREKHHLHLETTIYGVEMLRSVYEIVEQRLPTDRHQNHSSLNHSQSNISWCTIDQSLTANEQQSLILKELGKILDWGMVLYEYPSYDDRHQFYRMRCEEHTCDDFINSDTYRKWKNRQTRGPSLLFAYGAALVNQYYGETIDKFASFLIQYNLVNGSSQLVEDLATSRDTRIGVAYHYLSNNDFIANKLSYNGSTMLKFWIMQLALQLRVLPASDGIWPLEEYSLQQLEEILMSLLPRFRRTFIFVDEIWVDFNLYWENGELTTIVPLLRNLLEQDHGNISIAIFSRNKNEASLDPLLNLADVSVRVSTIEPSLQQYVHSKIMRLVRPALNEAGPQSASDSPSIAAIEEVIVQASDGLYLAVDVHIDSLLETIRARRDVAAFLRNTRENNEIMLQRDPESMKQKVFIPTTVGSTPSAKTTRKGIDDYLLGSS